MKNIVLYLLFIMSIVALFGFAFSMAQDNEPAGKTIFINSKCSGCHTIQSADISSKNKNAVDLSKTGDKLQADFIVNYLNKEIKLNDKQHKIAFKGSADDLNSLAGWLESLKTTN